MTIKIWLDDVRPAPSGYIHCRSVNTAKKIISQAEDTGQIIEVLDLDHDLGDYSIDGGDGIKLLDWLESRQKYYPVKLHTMNPVGRQNMQVIADRLRKYI